MLRPNPFGEAYARGNKVIASRFDIGLQEVIEAVDTHIAPSDEEDVFVQIVKDFWVLVSNVAPHHHALAVRAQHSVDAVHMLIVDRLRSKRVDICFGMALAEAFGLVAVDVEIGRLVGSCHFTEMVFKELVSLFLGGVEVPFRVGQMAVEGIAQNLLEMSETLLVANDLDVIRLAKILQFLDFLSGKSIGRGDVRVAFGLEGVLGVKRERIELTLCQLRNKAF